MKIQFALIPALFAMSGCTTITIMDEHGVVSVQREFGFVTVNAAPETDAVVAEITSLGYVASPVGISVGYGNHSVALLPPTCRVVLWIENKRDLAEFKSLMGDNASICPVVVEMLQEKKDEK